MATVQPEGSLMDLSFPDDEDVDSNCHRKIPDPDTPDAVLNRCKSAAATWFNRERGYRFYVCEDHAREVLRFGETDEDVLDMDYNELRSYASEKGISLASPTREDLLRRVLVAPDASNLSEHPRVSPCRGCHKLTLLNDLNPVERRCPACREGVPELDVDELILSSED